MNRDEMAAELLEHARLLSTPIDFEALICDGVIERHGKRYRVLDYDRLPEHAQKQVSTIAEKDGTMLVTFRRPNKRVAKLYEDLSGQRLPRDG